MFPSPHSPQLTQKTQFPMTATELLIRMTMMTLMVMMMMLMMMMMMMTMLMMTRLMMMMMMMMMSWLTHPIGKPRERKTAPQ